MYPLNLVKKLQDGAGFAVANTEDEHKALSEQGYEPKYVAPVVAAVVEPVAAAEPVAADQAKKK